MKLHMTSIASTLFLVGCSGSEGGGSGSPAIVTPAPTPTPTSPPEPTPTPSPTPAPTPTPSPSATTYLKFSDLYIYRLGPSLTLASACSGLAFQSPPATLPVSGFGQGLNFRYVLTPQVWAISGDGWALSFDGRFADPDNAGLEIAYVQGTGSEVERFTIARPMIGTIGIDYARLAAVTKRVAGVSRLYQCVVGVPTLASDLPAAAIAYSGSNVLGTALVRDGAGSRRHTLARSTVTIAADMAARRVTVALTLTATPVDAPGADVALATLAASVPLDGAGNFTGPIASGDGSITGTVSGRLFGPQGIEIGAAFAINAADAPGRAGFAAAGALYGMR